MKRINPFVSVLLVVCLFVAPTLAQQAAPVSKPQTIAELQARITALLDQPKFAAARWGVMIKAGQDKIVFERDVDKAFRR